MPCFFQRLKCAARSMSNELTVGNFRELKMHFRLLLKEGC